jgi:predicted  nucleic acid-binding Zn-ribbon protein
LESLTAKLSDLDGRHSFSQKQLASLTAEHQALRLERTSLQSQHDEHLGTIAGLRKAASQSAASQESLNQQLRTSHAELRSAIRRAEEAERTHQDLQNEGSSLMHSLDEMRPKMVELTNAKLELSERSNVLEQAVRDRDGVIVQLESSLQAAQDQNELLTSKLLDSETARERDRSSAQDTQDELQREYAQIETDLTDALASIRNLEVERAEQHHHTSKQVEELERMSSTSHSQKVELASLHRELEERKLAEVEQQEFLERARTDIEVLRADLVTKVQEIEELRAEVSTVAAHSASPSSPSSLDKEMMNSLKQQHRLELSAAQSQIRALQSSVFEAEARAHSFQKQLSQSEDQLAHLRAASTHVGAHRPFSPQGQQQQPSRPSSRQRNRSDELRRASLSQRRGGGGSSGVPPAAASGGFGANLSPETRHKRKVSLGMLKARIDSEMAAGVIPSVPTPRATSPLYHHHASAAADQDKTSSLLDPHATNDAHSLHRRSQFLDESHIFWCHSCRGELVVL